MIINSEIWPHWFAYPSQTESAVRANLDWSCLGSTYRVFDRLHEVLCVQHQLLHRFFILFTSCNCVHIFTSQVNSDDHCNVMRLESRHSKCSNWGITSGEERGGGVEDLYRSSVYFLVWKPGLKGTMTRKNNSAFVEQKCSTYIRELVLEMHSGFRPRGQWKHFAFAWTCCRPSSAALALPLRILTGSDPSTIQ